MFLVHTKGDAGYKNIAASSAPVKSKRIAGSYIYASNTPIYFSNITHKSTLKKQKVQTPPLPLALILKSLSLFLIYPSLTLSLHTFHLQTFPGKYRKVEGGKLNQTSQKIKT